MARLQDQAMIVSLHQRAWSAKATDRRIAGEVEDANDAESGTMRVIKELTPKQYISPIRSIMRIGKAEHDRITVGGFIRGQSLLSTANFDRYAITQSTIRDEFYQAVDRFMVVYPEVLALAPKRLSKAYRASDFPTIGQIRDYFEYDNKFLPIPAVHDWRLEGINTDEADVLRQQAEEQVRIMYHDATKEVFERAKVILENIANQAKEFGTGPNGSPLRDATIENLKEMAELVCTMNVANDPLLDEVGRDMVKEFADIIPAELRRSDELRHNVATAASRILSKIAKRND